MSTEDLLTLEMTKVNGEEAEEKVKGEVNAYVIIAVLVILATIATWVVPAGQYDRVKDAVTGREVVVAGSFHLVTFPRKIST